MSLQPETAHQEALHDLAALIRRQKLDGMASMVLEAIGPVAMIASQIALFTQPFIPTRGWQRYMNALGSEASWHTLRRMLDQQEC